ncbi:DUF6933 domain-containing protein [Candidatus Omnitrophota bacterium]
MIICCTAKLQKEIGLTNFDLAKDISDKSTLGEWYANLFYFDRRKHVIFINARTLFTFIAFDVKKPEIKNLGKLFRIGLGKTLLEENFEGALIQRLVNECQGIQFTKTHNRSVLGVMNDHVRHAKYMLMDETGMWNLSNIIKQLNRTPLLTKEFTFSVEELGRVLGIKVDPTLDLKSQFPHYQECL